MANILSMETNSGSTLMFITCLQTCLLRAGAGLPATATATATADIAGFLAMPRMNPSTRRMCNLWCLRVLAQPMCFIAWPGKGE